MNSVPEIAHLDSPRKVQSVSFGGDATLVHTTVGQMDNNVWIICRGGQALVIDAATDAPFLLELLEQLEVDVTDVLTTHQHFDHVQALNEVLEATGARHHAGRADAPDLPAAADETYGTDDGSPEQLRLAGSALAELSLTTVELRGHTPGGIAVIGHGRAFVGDSVFPGGVGKTDNAQDFTQLVDDVEQRILSLPGDTRIHPGHGDSTTVAEEKPKVSEWRQRGW
ncbi:MAG TPA: MBL fold metallo-hydrolase [Candidatus Corynebacterium gallistercoris]|uniref:MBL fold metallo-hydrolase n=1 Tax=Candidatus Corynebacterium gallistercoris TaxID=2838530 RepID=A0A9D1RWR2_9CORY|nr:MBL fold metallo-hydrolase [Candidatus Corynebacterium gallistercoris]